ncbi:hypothetical protein ACFWIO_24045 [Streptomyces diastatochromogenes]|uniref:hypothetical protein n=1 Tax=Streptomyces diastatochromogenes TaxID=42236 RepID=UPI00364981D1
MDTLTKLNTLSLILCAGLVAMACVKADRVRAWRSSINPSAPELPDAAFVVGRVVLVTMAAIGVYTSIQGFGVADDMSWDDRELSSAVQHARDDLDGYMFRVDDSGTPDYFSSYESLLEEKVVENGGGDAPQDGVTATAADDNTADDAYFTVTAEGADAAFCTHIERTRSKKDDYSPPGLNGRESFLKYRGYRMAVTAQQGEC